MSREGDRARGVYRAEDGRFETRLAATMAETERLLAEAGAEGFSRDASLRAMRRESLREVRLSAGERRRVRRMLERGDAYDRAEAVERVLGRRS